MLEGIKAEVRTVREREVFEVKYEIMVNEYSGSKGLCALRERVPGNQLKKRVGCKG